MCLKKEMTNTLKNCCNQVSLSDGNERRHDIFMEIRTQIEFRNTIVSGFNGFRLMFHSSSVEDALSFECSDSIVPTLTRYLRSDANILFVCECRYNRMHHMLNGRVFHNIN